jgi:hypothetical protein
MKARENCGQQSWEVLAMTPPWSIRSMLPHPSSVAASTYSAYCPVVARISKLVLGWTPRQPQDGIALSPELLAMLSSIGAIVLIDTYSDD